ncbi:MAG: DUF1015 domain-containing protein [Chloroflexota bacterium]|nr:MAG: DUF1015 domain-containing protein [Chloroflexota bacterium]
MAIIKPFRAIRYNQDKISHINDVISQPYDRVRYGLQDEYYALSEYNVTRIIKGKEFDTDSETDNVYTRANDFLNQWLKDGILKREGQPAYYVYHQTFPLPSGKTITRKAFICAFELSGFDEGIVLPHEKTHAGPKIDRLNLTRATETYFGNIFMLYPDQENKIDAIFDHAIQNSADIEAKELHEKDVLHQVWVVTDPEIISQVNAEMADKTNLIIADGHHRYETALNYQAEMMAKHPNAAPNAGFNYRMAAMVSMSNPGLTILPTHRLIFDYQTMTSAQILTKAAEFFEIEQQGTRESLEEKLGNTGSQIGTIGFASKEGFYYLTLKSQEAMAELAPGRAQAWRDLDVSILHKLLLGKIMQIDPKKIDNLENIKYLREPDIGYDEVNEKDTSFLFILNSTRIDQVTACTDDGEKMPQKSTDFYPKIVTGFAMLPVQKDETL